MWAWLYPQEGPAFFLAQVSHNGLGSICACRIAFPVQIEKIGTNTIGNIVEQSKDLEDNIRELKLIGFSKFSYFGNLR
jgi:hypothetical protein